MGTLTDAQVNGRSLVGGTLTPADAGAKITYYIGDKVCRDYVTDYLYRDEQQPHMKPEQAALKGNRLPSPLTPGQARLKVKRQGEGDDQYVQWQCPVIGSDSAKLIGKMRLGLSDLAHKPYSVTKDLIAPLKLSSLRAWCGSGGFAAYKRDSEIANAITYARAGLDPIYCVAQEAMTPEMAIKAPKWVLAMVTDLIAAYDSDPATKGKIVRIQFGNEPDLSKADKSGQMVKTYWRGTLDEYFAALRSVYQVVTQAYGDRVQIIAAGWSWDFGSLSMKRDGFKNACHAIAFHGYPKSIRPQDMQYKAVSVVAKSIGKLAIVSEGSPGYGKGVKAAATPAAAAKVMAQWAADWPKYLLALETAGIDECVIFNAVDIGTTNSAGAMFDKSWQPTACYQSVKAVIA